jgi:hypothetical protein
MEPSSLGRELAIVRADRYGHGLLAAIVLALAMAPIADIVVSLL